jgi:hypothetical protein
MNQRVSKPTRLSGGLRTTTWLVAIAISLVLLVASYGKFFHPSEGLKTLDQGISIFEILLIAVILFLRTKKQMWLSVAPPGVAMRFSGVA